MSFFSIFKSSKKNTSNQEKVRLYKDHNFKDYVKNIQIDDNTTSGQLLKSIVPNQMGEDIVRFIVLITITKDKSQSLQRILHSDEQVLKILNKTQQNHDQHLLYIEQKSFKLNELQLYHHESLKFNCLVQSDNQEGFYRQGILLKKTKNGQFRERLFKLMRDCLVYNKIEKNKQQKLSYVSLDSMQIEKSKDKNLIFELIVDQKTFTLRAQSKTDYEGWIYSLHYQIMKWKEVKLINDYDKKTQIIQKSKVDSYKNIAVSSFTLKYLIKQNNFITEQFFKFVRDSQNEIDLKLLDFLITCQKIEEIDQFKFKSNTEESDVDFIKKRDELHKLLIDQVANSPFFQLMDNHSILNFKHNTYAYFDATYLSKFSGSILQYLLNFQVHHFKNYFSFPLPDFQDFWNDPIEESSSPSKKSASVTVISQLSALPSQTQLN